MIYLCVCVADSALRQVGVEVNRSCGIYSRIYRENVPTPRASSGCVSDSRVSYYCKKCKSCNHSKMRSSGAPPSSAHERKRRPSVPHLPVSPTIEAPTRQGRSASMVSHELERRSATRRPVDCDPAVALAHMLSIGHSNSHHREDERAEKSAEHSRKKLSHGCELRFELRCMKRRYEASGRSAVLARTVSRPDKMRRRVLPPSRAQGFSRRPGPKRARHRERSGSFAIFPLQTGV